MKFTKLGKMFVAICAVFTFALGLIGCVTTNPSEPTHAEKVEQAKKDIATLLDKIFFSEQLLNSTTSSFEVVKVNKNYPDVTIEWSSSATDLIEVGTTVTDNKVQATVNRPDFEDPRVENGAVAVTLTVVASQQVDDEVVNDKKEFKFNVQAVDAPEFGSIRDIKTIILNDLKERNIALNTNDSKGAKFCMTYARVLYIWSKSMVISDGTDSMVVYGDWASKCNVGDLVLVKGQVYSYYGNIEFGSEISLDKVEEGTTLQNPVTKEEYKKTSEIVLNEYVNQEISVYTSLLTASQTEAKRVLNVEGLYGFSGGTYKLYAKVLKEDLGCGDKYALEDPNTGVKISIYHYATDGAEQTTVMDALVGKYVYINCITIDRYSSNDVYRVLWDGTTPTEAPAPVLSDAQKLANAVDAIKNANLLPSYYNGQEFAYPEVKIDGVNVNWTSSVEGLVVDGKLVVVEDGKVTLTATITCGELSEEVTLELTVLKEENVLTVAEYKAAELKTYATLKGLVSAVYARGFVLTDETGSILVYTNKAVSVKIGDYVKVRGVYGVYPDESTCYQVGNPIAYETLEGAPSYTLAEAVEWTPEQLDAAWAQVVAGTYNFAGPLVKMTVKVSVSGNYINATLEGSTVALSFSFPLDEVKQYLTNGATVTVYAMPISYSTKTVDGAKVPGYFNFIITNVELNDETVANAELNKLTVPAEATEDFELPTLEGLVWSLKEDSAVITLNGNAVTLTFPETDTTVVLVATYTYKGVAYTKEFSVFVKGTVVEKPELKTEFETTSFAGIEALVPNADDTTTEKYYVIGFVKSITNATYGNMVITDENGKELTIYGTYSFDGSARFDAMDKKPVEGDVVVLYGIANNFKGTAQIKNGWLMQINDEVQKAAPTPAGSSVYTWAANDGTLVDNVLTIETEDFTIIISKNKSTNDVVNTYAQCRIYQGASVQIIAKNGKKISSVSFTDLGGKNPESVDFSLDANSAKLSATVASNVWTLTASEGLDSMTFVTVKQMRFTSLTVTFAE
ncbi:MAG: hypothetical protein NC090_04285 [Anaeroplasma bactoclasticum]|nr:hypothetical protein [Anaeroplasma bactoclasticum]